MFLREREAMVANLATAIDQSDVDAIRRSAHTIKGTMSHLGARQCTEIAIGIEESCTDSREENQAKYLKLKQKLVDLTVELERFRSGHQTR